MTKRPDLPQRKPLRLHGFDYRSAGAYFVTICAQGRRCLFGAVADGALQRNEAGRIVAAAWAVLPVWFADVALDAWVVMPNHIHGIVWLGADVAAGDVMAGGETPPLRALVDDGPGDEAPLQRRTLGQVVAFFKYQSTKAINALHGTPGQKVWQRNYYDHIICNEADLNRIRTYIANNPAQWELDQLHPDHPSKW